MPIPDFQEIMLPVLRYGNGQIVKVRDASAKVCEEFKLTKDEREDVINSGGQNRVLGRTGWAVTYLVQAGLLHRPRRAHFTTTDKGREVLAQNPKKIDKKFLQQFPDFVDFQRRVKKRKSTENNNDNHDVDEKTPEEQIDSAYEEILSRLSSDLLQKTLDASPAFFERLIINLLVAMGYGGSVEQAGQHLGKSGDEGVDGVINEDKLGLDLLYIQAKRYNPNSKVGSPDIHKFVGSLAGKGANRGVFVTTSSFTKDAEAYVEKTLQHRIVLIDGEMLTKLMINHDVGIRNSRTIKLKKIDEDFFEEE